MSHSQSHIHIHYSKDATHFDIFLFPTNWNFRIPLAPSHLISCPFLGPSRQVQSKAAQEVQCLKNRQDLQLVLKAVQVKHPNLHLEVVALGLQREVSGEAIHIHPRVAGLQHLRVVLRVVGKDVSVNQIFKKINWYYLKQYCSAVREKFWDLLFHFITYK